MRRALVPLLALGLLLAACGDDGEEVDAGSGDEPAAPTDGGGSAPAAGPTGGGEYVATGITEGGAVRPLVDGTELRITFVPVEGEADALPQLSMTAGCNTLGASYDVVGDTLEVGDVFSTQMGCEEPLADQDAWLTTVVTGEVGWSLDGDTLTLTSGEVEITLVDRAVAAPDATLVGPTWTLDTIVTGAGDDGAASSVPDGVTATINFADDGTAAFQTGCNEGSASYRLDGDAVTLSDFAVEEAGCTGDAGEVEQAVLAVLGSEGQPFTVAVDEDRLTLTSADDATGLAFTAA